MSRESHAECPNDPKATVGIGKDPNDMGTSANLLVEALKHVGRFQVFAVGERQAEVGQGLFDVVLDPAGELGIFSAPFGEPSRKIAPIIHPAQLLSAIAPGAAGMAYRRQPKGAEGTQERRRYQSCRSNPSPWTYQSARDDQ